MHLAFTRIFKHKYKNQIQSQLENSMEMVSFRPAGGAGNNPVGVAFIS